jgi:hypothetical protein
MSADWPIAFRIKNGSGLKESIFFALPLTSKESCQLE